ncbi:MAG TPA: YhgE/Pip domain-containing protein [Clostridia bacterium]|nr:YhgE/Pip domain-containing protein [Clostridia bacterium]
MLKFNTKTKRIAVVTAVILIPLIYSFFYLYAFWDPYSKLEDLPVAIVNQDQGSVINGDTRNAGKEIVEELKTDKSLKWIITSQSDASDGLKNRKYYAEILIPKDFSNNLSTVDKDKKTPGVLIYTANEKRNFLAAQVLNRGMLEFKDRISKKLTKEIVSNITIEVKKLPKNLLELVDKMDQATNGSGQLYNGISDLKKNQLEFNNGIEKLNNGLAKLNTGSNTLKNGEKSLYEGLSSGSTEYKKLAAGSTQFKAKLSELNTGASSLNAGASDLNKGALKLNKGASDLNTGASKLNTGISTLNSGLSKLNSAISGFSSKAFSDGISQYTEGVKTLTAADKTVSDLLQAYLKAHPEAMNDKNIQNIIAISQKSNGALDKINAASDSIKSGSDVLSGSMNQITSAVKQLSGGSTLLMQASNQLYSGTAQLKDGSTQLKDGSTKLKAGMTQLKDGSTKLVIGYAQLDGGIQQALGKMKQAADGAKQLYDGSQTLNTGLSEAYKGSNKLNSNAGKFVDGENKLQAGAKTLFDGLSDGKTQVGDKIGLLNINLNKLDGVDSYASEPLKMEDKKLNPVPDYGTAFAPYFMSLSLWVGSLLIFYTIYLDPEIKFKRVARNSKGYLRFFSYYIIAIVQALVLGVVIEKGLGLDVKNIPLFYGVCILVSLTFISIMQFLIVHLRDVGKFIAILLLILQLTSCGGTFPMELVPKFFNDLFDFMPMTYSVNVFKETISGIDYGYLTRNVIILGVTMIVFLLVSFIISKKTGLNKDEGILIDDKLTDDVTA